MLHFARRPIPILVIPLELEYNKSVEFDSRRHYNVYSKKSESLYNDFLKYDYPELEEQTVYNKYRW